MSRSDCFTAFAMATHIGVYVLGMGWLAAQPPTNPYPKRIYRKRPLLRAKRSNLRPLLFFDPPLSTTIAHSLSRVLTFPPEWGKRIGLFIFWGELIVLRILFCIPKLNWKKNLSPPGQEEYPDRALRWSGGGGRINSSGRGGPPGLWPEGEFFVLNDHIFISTRELEKEISFPRWGGVRSEAVGGGWFPLPTVGARLYRVTP